MISYVKNMRDQRKGRAKGASSTTTNGEKQKSAMASTDLAVNSNTAIVAPHLTAS